ncbi:outer membrane immunogenic protein [Devosia sp. UYZn731]|uniref:outer membrane protein n=1 Tax=Devosia sp. UYZn731 TaxID=3156345 RepID=UPI0033954221
MFVRSLSLGVAAVALLSSGAMAADLIIPTTPQPIYESAGFSWDGLYAGVEAGGVFADDVAGVSNSRGLVGAVVGVNFTVADPIVLGVELQGDYLFENDNVGDAGLFLALGHVGAVVTDQVLVYAAGGFGAITQNGDSSGVYALGAGVDFAVTDNVSIRGEILGLGNFDDNNNDFFDAAKATVGVFYHF